MLLQRSQLPHVGDVQFGLKRPRKSALLGSSCSLFGCGKSDAFFHQLADAAGSFREWMQCSDVHGMG
jgi:hypothetical protein